MKKPPQLTHTSARWLVSSILFLTCAWGPSARLGATEISDQPLIHSQGSKQPNLMFILDNSGSMLREYMPEYTDDRGAYSIWSWHCNGAAFNPSPNVPGIYRKPKTHDGRDYPQMLLTAAWDDGFQPSFARYSTHTISVSVNTETLAEGTSQDIVFTVSGEPFGASDALAIVEPTDPTHWATGQVVGKYTVSSSTATRSTYTVRLTYSSFRNGTVSNWSVGKPRVINLTSSDNPTTTHYYKHADDSETADTEPARPWKYTSSGAFDRSDPFVADCLSSIGSDRGSKVFTKKMVSDLDDAGKQRYANWYSYYRSRLLMMRSAAGLAMNSIEPNFRVGFSALNKEGVFNADVSNRLWSFVSASSFDADHRRLFFSNLYGTPAGGSTPLRRALAKVGQYYGNRLTGQSDPMISSCQRNYSILTTDGYWNESTLPTRLNLSTAIGNQDGEINVSPRPEYDGSAHYSEVYERTNYRLSTDTCSSSSKKKYTSYKERKTDTITPSGTTPGTWTAVAGSSGKTTSCQSSPPDPSASELVRTIGGAAPNTLADVAHYYYNTDLRSDLANNVPSSSGDPKKTQHMTTFTLGLGLSGNLQYKSNYKEGGAPDFEAILAGTLNWPIPPLTSDDSPAKIDDLWHAAVNGHGRYFSASSANALVDSLQSTFNDIKAETGAGSSAASTSLRPVLGTDQVFVASYQTMLWNGELQSFTIDKQGPDDAPTVVLTTKAGVDWKASDDLATRAYTSRRILYRRHATSTTWTLGDFTWSNLSSDTDSASLTPHFSDFCSKSFKPTQCDVLSTTERSSASGENLVNFLRGDSTHEDTLYRTRFDDNNNKRNKLGDMVDASPVYVGKPPFSYTGQGYPEWKESKKARCPVVYAAANDGMLHAFSARTASSDSSCATAGQEIWAYIPRAVMPNLYRLADSDYANRHIFTVNGSPVVADVSTQVGDTTTWQTILVGGLGAGGRAYYALDVTDPNAPAPLWEFSNQDDTDLGFTFGNPVITRVRNSSGDLVWAAVFTSGLNNGGNGYLYVLEALTGKLMYKVPTMLNGTEAAGTSSEPNGLNKLNAWVVTPSDNEAQYFYAADLKGNIWRFNASELTAPSSPSAPDYRAVRLAQLKKNGIAQPITVKPELAEVKHGSQNHMVVMVGTGQYLGDPDAKDFSTPWSVYAIKDTLASTGWGDVRPSMVGQTLSAIKQKTSVDSDGVETTSEYRSISANDVDWSSESVAGWYVDMPLAGERVVVGMNLAYTTLTVASLVPKTSTDDCNNSGESWLYDFDISKGSFVSENKVTQQGGYKAESAVMGINTLQPEGSKRSSQVITYSDGSSGTREHVKAPTTSGQARRTAWRELTP
jgi:type IV pilus assembly protein PilY1